MPELPWVKRDRYKKDYGMTEKEVAVFVESVELAKYFESVIAGLDNDMKKIKLAINYILSDYLPSFDPAKPIAAASFAELISMIAAGEISSRGAKDTLALLVKDPENSARKIAEKNSLLQKSDAADNDPTLKEIQKAMKSLQTKRYKAVGLHKVSKIMVLEGRHALDLAWCSMYCSPLGPATLAGPQTSL